MYKIIVTGATGQIGSEVLSHLGQLGYECDTLSHDEFDHESFDKIKDCDVLVHCAWIRNPDLHSTQHLEFIEPCCHLFDYCKKNGVRVINMGSGSEYGTKYEPMQEDMPCKPNTTYGIAKLAVTLYAQKLGFNTLRLFAVMGGKGSHCFADIYKNTDKWSAKENVRDYVPISKVTKAVERLIHAQHIYGEVINICTGRQQYQYGVAGVDSDNKKFDKYPQRQYEPSHWYGNTDKMRNLLNIDPLVIV